MHGCTRSDRGNPDGIVRRRSRWSRNVQRTRWTIRREGFSPTEDDGVDDEVCEAREGVDTTFSAVRMG